jgi:soluble lytic murein transglycosylase
VTVRSLRVLVSALVVAACRSELPPPPLHVGVESAADAPSGSPAVGGQGRWFTDGPGADAMAARLRRDHETAQALLAGLAADPALDAGDRGAAALLLAVEELQAGQPAAAAEHFAVARATPVLAPVRGWIALQEARARLDAGDPAAARALVVDLSVPEHLEPERTVVEAAARARTGDVPGAIERWRDYLRRWPEGVQRQHVRLELARRLIEASEGATAAELLEQVVLAVPLSDFGTQADAELEALDGAGTSGRDAAARATFERSRQLARLRARLDRREYAALIRDAERIARRDDLKPAERCEVAWLRATATFKQRERADARPYFDRAVELCGRADERDTAVRSAYQSARGRYAAGEHRAAAEAFERIAERDPGHSYADDALVLAGESWEEAGDPARARAAWERALSPAHRGDMAGEARRRLLVQNFAAGRHEEVIASIGEALADPGLDLRQRAAMSYFLGRAHEERGDIEAAVDAWNEAAALLPISYPAAQALSRLADRSEPDLERALARLDGASRDDGPAPAAADGEVVARAEMFARLGLGDPARAELEAGKVGGWAAAQLLHQAGLYDAVQSEVADLGLSWRATPPGAADSWRWRIAHPVPFLELIGPGEREQGVPPLLTYAIMQTESRFDPGATSWAGARGLVQLMPGTARSVARQAGLPAPGEQMLYDPATNLGLGMRYLARLSRRWGGGDAGPVLAIPSYNAGAGAVDGWVAERGTWPLDLFLEAIPYDETRHYTHSVLERWFAYRWLYGDGAARERLLYLPRAVPDRVSVDGVSPDPEP